MNSYIVYRHTSPSGNVYIGITKHGDNPEKRWGRGRRYEHCPAFYNAIHKYGWDNIEHEVLYNNLSKEEADAKEIELIAIYKEQGISYNITDGGEGSLGVPMSEENKKLHSERMKINNPTTGMTDEWRQHIADSQRGKKMSQEFCRKTSERMKANNPMKNPEFAEKMAAKKRGTHITEEHLKRISKKCILYDLEHNEIGRFDSIKDCSKYIGCSDSTIADFLHGRAKMIFKKYTVKYD